MIHKSRTNTTPRKLLVSKSSINDKRIERSENYEQRKLMKFSGGYLVFSGGNLKLDNQTPRQEEPDLEFIAEGTNKIMLSNSILAQFCPHIEYCPQDYIDTNCYMEKFFHCEEARVLERQHLLSQTNKFYLRYRKLILNGGYNFQVR